MFSVPLSIEIVAPEDSANHSTGRPRSSARSSAAITRAHSGSATVPSALRRVAEQRHPGHALGVARRRRGHHADDDAGRVLPGRPVDRHEPADVVEVVLDEGAARPGQQRGQLVRVDRPRARELSTFCGVVVQRRHRLGRPVGHLQLARRCRAGCEKRSATSRGWLRRALLQPGQQHDLVRARRRPSAARRAGRSAPVGQRHLDRRPGVEEDPVVLQRPPGPPPRLRPPQAVQAGGRAPLHGREADDLARVVAAAGSASRTSAIAMSRSSFGLSFATQWNR